jgi:hypothetical protein
LQNNIGRKDYFSILSPCVPVRNIGGVPVGRGG